MLTPAADDPKRNEELRRAKKDPNTFGADIGKVRHDLPATGGLTAERDAEEAPTEEAPTEEAPQSLIGRIFNQKKEK